MIKNGIEKIIELTERKLLASKTKSVLKTLGSSDDELIRRFADTLNFVFSKNKNRTDDEIAAFKIIDEIKSGYLSSDKTVNVKDYGAGSPVSKRSENQMHAGLSRKVNISDVYKTASTKAKWGELIYKIIREFKPDNCLELGTSLGVSGAYQILGLKLNGSGKFTTIEGAEELAQIADGSLQKLNYPHYNVLTGRFIDVLPGVLSENTPLDFVFIDGHHDKAATLNYYKLIYPFLNKKAIVIFDDVNWSVGMREMWKIIYKDGKGIKMSFDLYKWGICFVDKEENSAQKKYYKIVY